MKALFFLLLLINIVLPLWEIGTGRYVDETRDDAQNASRWEDLEAIVLVDEMGPDWRPARIAADDASVSSASSTQTGNADDIPIPAAPSGETTVPDGDETLADASEAAVEGQPEATVAAEDEAETAPMAAAETAGEAATVISESDVQATEAMTASQDDQEAAGGSTPSFPAEGTEAMTASQDDREAAGDSNSPFPEQATEAMAASGADDGAGVESSSSFSAAATVAEDSLPPPACYEVGPFAGTSLALEIVRAVQKAEGSAEVVTRRGDVTTGYMVMYPAERTFAESRANLAKLRKLGHTDLWLFDQGKLKGAISMGLFSDRTRAERLRDELRGRNLKVSIEPRVRKRKQFWVQVTWQKTEQAFYSVLEESGVASHEYGIQRRKTCP